MSKLDKEELGFYTELKEEADEKVIIEQYNINGDKYSIMYLEDKKAIDVFTALNRMIVSGKSFDSYNGVTINRMFTPTIMNIPIEKKKWWKI